MDKDTRNWIERATQRARKLLEEDFSAQLEGTFDVLRTGTVAAKGGAHLSARQGFQRDKIVAAIEHKRAAGMTAAEAVTDYVRDAAFTTLNRFVALKMLEARELVQECISKGDQSTGYREFCGMAPGVALLPDAAGYRLFVESLFDELSTEVKVLFDRRDAASALWPKRPTFDTLLQVLNDIELTDVWREDETIGWVYQYFNSKDERQAMRDMRGEGAQAPRTSRELAIRNQFFTPKFIVRFLTQNSVGRLWLEMRRGQTALTSDCEYLYSLPDKNYWSRTKKDPRDLRIIDPACGSGHFLLYAFGLLVTVYEEAWHDSHSPLSEVTGRTLRKDYPELADLKVAAPGLILNHNLYGVDIDARCAQIAQFALWMAAQKAYQHLGIARDERPAIRRSNIVIGEAMPGERDLQQEFVARLVDPRVKEHFDKIVKAMTLAGHLGVLLRIEQLVGTEPRLGETGDLLAAPAGELKTALVEFAEIADARAEARRRLFSDDALHGLGLLDLAEKKYDVVLMNPPFGRPTETGFTYLRDGTTDQHQDIAAAFIQRAVDLLQPDGIVAAIAPRPLLTMRYLERWRRSIFNPRLDAVVDLGLGVMDGAMVRSCCYVLRGEGVSAVRIFDAALQEEKEPALLSAITTDPLRLIDKSRFDALPYAKVLLRAPEELLATLASTRAFEPMIGTARQGPTTSDDFRFLRLWWEVLPSQIGRGNWEWHPKNGPGGAYWRRALLVINRRKGGHEMAAHNINVNGQTAQSRQSSTYYYRPGSYYLYRAATFSAAVLPRGCVMAHVAPAVLSESDVPAGAILGWLNSTLVRYLIQLQASAEAYPTGIVKKLSWPPAIARADVDLMESLAVDSARDVRQSLMFDERDVFSQYVDWWANPESSFRAVVDRCEAARERVRARQAELDDVVSRCYGIDLVLDDESVPELAWDDIVASPCEQDFAMSIIYVWLATAFRERPRRRLDLPEDVFAELAPDSKSIGKGRVLVDDLGHPDDVIGALVAAVADSGALDPESWMASLFRMLGTQDDGRAWIAQSLFSEHVRRFSANQRTAPLLWQLSVKSARYSLWVHAHGFSRDTPFSICNDLVGPKLAHEERRLESLRSEHGVNPTASERKLIAAHESFVDELRAFMEELRRIAPLWNPALDDGVIINVAPLWRLVPQNKAWQKELKTTWDALCEGKFDWAHLAMNLWPERVVPKCATDRSLAIAHGLEDVFWAEGADGKWKGRSNPTRSIDDLVRERSSPAVKAALESLLDAPMAAAGGGRGRRVG